ncbi:DnaT-like ssDNA-binding domain-containing protein [Saccharospirillum impatiens]|uniref:DnaT-like ssDNA-binding domain-containing protein n=1 Tax=Saccharospirillum impatiens TaxID=169438 RepID=UPI00048B069C|nr:DnaT-like ssDNA-binding domain-containing protein [Saccharospirillum impatiens]
MVSPALAETLGLEEALLYQLLTEMALLLGPRVALTEQHRQQLLPFWSNTQLSAVLRRVQAQGLLTVHNEDPWQVHLEDLDDSLIPPEQPWPATGAGTNAGEDIPVERVPVRTMNRPVQAAEPGNPPAQDMNDARRRNQVQDDLAYLKPEKPDMNTVRAERTRMHAEWEPGPEFPGLLSFHDIPLTYALAELAKFRQYYQDKDRAEFSWDVRFLNWVQRSWHDQLNNKGRHERTQQHTQEPANPAREKRAKVREALRNIRDTDW